MSLAQHLAANTYRRDRHGELPPGGRAAVLATARAVQQLSEPAPVPSEDLDGASFVARLKAEFKDWSSADLTVLVLVGQQLDRLRDVREGIAAGGLVVATGRRGRPSIVSSLLRVERQTVNTIALLLRQLGLRDED